MLVGRVSRYKALLTEVLRHMLRRIGLRVIRGILLLLLLLLRTATLKRHLHHVRRELLVLHLRVRR